MLRMLRRQWLGLLSTGAFGLIMFSGNDLFAGKPGGTTPPPPPTPLGTIYFSYPGGMRAMNSDGTNKQLVCSDNLSDGQLGEPSKLVYGTDTYRHRWWLGTDEMTRELHAFKLASDGLVAHHFLITDVTDSVVPLWYSEIMPRWSNDGLDSFVSFVGVDRVTEETHVYWIDITGADLEAAAVSAMPFTPATVATLNRVGPVLPNSNQLFTRAFHWSPNGNALTYCVENQNGDDGLYVSEFDSASATWTNRLIFAARSLSGPNWSPDGSTIAFTGTGPIGNGYLYTVPPAGGPANVLVVPTQSYYTGAGDQQWSPPSATAGPQLAYLHKTYSKKNLGTPLTDVARIPASGGSAVMLTNEIAKTSQKRVWAWVSNATFYP